MTSDFSWRHILYRLRDAEGTLPYVGITNDLNRRFGVHRQAQRWWGEVRDCRTEFFPNRAELLHAEWTVIRDEHPLYNVRHSSSDAFLADRAAAARRRRALKPPPHRCSPLGIDGAPAPGHIECGMWPDGRVDNTCHIYRAWQIAAAETGDEARAAVERIAEDYRNS